MEVFSDILQLDCIYQFEGDIKDNYHWNGLVIVDFHNELSEQNNGAVFSLEGLSIDKSDTQNSIEIHKRYLLGNGGIEQNANKVSFSVFPGNIAPLDYIVQYDESDYCFYGAWYWVNNFDFSSTLGGFVKISISPVYDKKRQDIQREIDAWCISKYYKQYLKTICHLIDSQKANISEHNDLNDLIFKEAKEYFKKIESEKVLKLDKYNI